MIQLLLLFTIMNSLIIVDFSTGSDRSNWNIVNDIVMGGNSTGKFYINSEGNGVFKGVVSLANSGGFASVRYRFRQTEISGYTKFVIRLKGDGKRYQLRVKSSTPNFHSYIKYFTTSKDWQIVEITLNELYPSFRGRKLNQPAFSGEKIEEIGFLVGNKKAEDFKLEIDKIELR